MTNTLGKDNAPFAKLFEGAYIPDGKDGNIPKEPYVYSLAEIQKIEALQQKVVGAITTGQSVNIYFDNDGTLFSFVPNPKDVKMDEGAYRGLVRLTQHENVSAISLTGRDVNEAASLMLTPGYAVNDTRGNIIAAKGDKTLRFSVIGSHGVERRDPDGTVTRYDFGKDFGPQVNDLIAAFKQDANALREQFPGIHVESEKHGALGINVATIIDNTRQGAAREAVAQLMEKYATSAQNPVNPATGEKLFQVKKEGDNESELRPVGFGKDFGIREFGGKPDPNALTIFFCDSLGKDGTDKPAAEYVKQNFPNGVVVQVLNGRITTQSESADVMFTSPKLLGAFLENVATAAENSLSPGSKPSPATSTAPKRTLEKV